MHREQALSAGWISGSKRFAREYSTLRAVRAVQCPSAGSLRALRGNRLPPRKLELHRAQMGVEPA